MSRWIFFNYIVTSIVSIFVNLGVQRIVLSSLSNADNITIAIIFGTFAGLISKFFLDKEITFKTQSKHKKNLGVQFLAYATLGVFTTSIFWGFEFYFWMAWKTEMMREIGAIIGLSLGYSLKLFLDKKYIFIEGHKK